jgi:uncharacterized membrane protein HdeD (DUF308 family)
MNVKSVVAVSRVNGMGGSARMNEIHHKPLTKRRMLTTFGSVAVMLGIVVVAAGWWSEHRVIEQLGLVALVVGVFWLVCARFASDEPLRTAQRRYLREFIPPMISYMLLLFCSLEMLKHVHAWPLRTVIALLPVVPIGFVVRAMVRLVLASDELEQRVQLEAISIASLSVGLLSFAAAFLHAAGLLPVENLLMLVLPALFAVYGLAVWWVKRRYAGA